MRQRSLAIAAATVMTLAVAPAAAKAQGLPGCYGPLRLKAPAPSVELVVMVDQTTPLDAVLAKSLTDNALRQLRPGVRFHIVEFSAFNQGRYMREVASGEIEGRLTQSDRMRVGAKTLRELDRCQSGQLNYARRWSVTELSGVLSRSSAGLRRSDIMGSLREAGPLLATSKVPNRVLLLASDMLENSAEASFYVRGGLKTLEPEAELHNAAARGLLANLGGARVYVIGGGLLPSGRGGSAETDGTAADYRSGGALERLRAFWSSYFTRSNAKLVEFGTPALLNPLP